MGSIWPRILLLSAVGAALCAGGWTPVRAQSGKPAAESSKMAPLLAQSAGASTCFVGTFTGQAMDIEDWSRARNEPTERLSPDGKPYMRPVPPVMKATPIRSFTLQLTYDSRKSDYDWIYNFRLLAEAEGIGTMYAAGECPWYAKDKVRDKRPIAASTTGMLCYIDCDGGFFDLERIAGAPALAVSFDTVHGLKMKGGCGGGGIYLVKAAQPGGIAFRLQTASAQACRPLEAWAARQ